MDCVWMSVVADLLSVDFVLIGHDEYFLSPSVLLVSWLIVTLFQHCEAMHI